VDGLDLDSRASQPKHMVVVVFDDLCLGGIDAERVSKAVNLLGGELDRASRGEKLPRRHGHIGLAQLLECTPKRGLVRALLPLHCSEENRLVEREVCVASDDLDVLEVVAGRVQRFVEDGRELEEVPDQDNAKAAEKLVAVLGENLPLALVNPRHSLEAQRTLLIDDEVVDAPEMPL
jgi:hypothetical protein